MYFTEIFIRILIYLALAGISITTIALVVLVIKDIKSKELW
jgi:hypothetical protein